jgi:hypothetical protein
MQPAARAATLRPGVRVSVLVALQLGVPVRQVLAAWNNRRGLVAGRENLFLTVDTYLLSVPHSCHTEK